MRQLQPRELAEWLADDTDPSPPPQLLDVREPWEVAICSLAGATAIPMRDIPARTAELDAARPIVCICHHGMRSQHVAIFLEHHGFPDVANLVGGIDGWSRDVDPSCPTY